MGSPAPSVSLPMTLSLLKSSRSTSPFFLVIIISYGEYTILPVNKGDHSSPEKFWAKVQKTPDCWLWTRGTNNGYGITWFRGRGWPAHRLSYELLVGPIPEGLTIDHLCRNRACCRPDHLEAVSPGVNVLRGVGPAAVHARKTHCNSGHPFNDENTRTWHGARYCRPCQAINAAKRRERARESTDPFLLMTTPRLRRPS